MPNIDTYTATSPTGREFARLSQEGHVKNWNPAFNMAHLDGLTDVTAALNTAMTSARNGRIDDRDRPRVFLPSGKYLISDTVVCRECSVVSDGAIILCEGVGAGKVAFSWDQATERQWQLYNGPAGQGLRFRGRATEIITMPPTFTAGTFAIGAAAPYLNFIDIDVVNFDAPVRFGQFAYLQTYRKCHFTFNNIGLSWPGKFGVSGENIHLQECSLSNNNQGFSIRNFGAPGNGLSGSMSMWLNNCSIDYNVTRHGEILAATTDPNDHLTQVSLIDCHLETSDGASSSVRPRIENTQTLLMSGCHIYETGAFDSIVNTPWPGRTTLLGTQFSIPNDPIMCKGNGAYKAFGSQRRYGGAVRITATLND